MTSDALKLKNGLRHLALQFTITIMLQDLHFPKDKEIKLYFSISSFFFAFFTTNRLLIGGIPIPHGQFFENFSPPLPS